MIISTTTTADEPPFLSLQAQNPSRYLPSVCTPLPYAPLISSHPLTLPYLIPSGPRSMSVPANPFRSCKSSKHPAYSHPRIRCPPPISIARMSIPTFHPYQAIQANLADRHLKRTSREDSVSAMLMPGHAMLMPWPGAYAYASHTRASHEPFDFAPSFLPLTYQFMRMRNGNTTGRENGRGWG